MATIKHNLAVATLLVALISINKIHASSPPDMNLDNNLKPSAPKRPLSAFFWFCKDESDKITQTLEPGAYADETSRQCAQRWMEAGPLVKAKYEAVAAKDQARYEKELSQYEQQVETSGAPNGD